MAQSLSQIYVHLVFSTKNREPTLSDKGLRSEMHAYLAGTCGNLKCPAVLVSGVADRVHILCRLGGEIAVSVVIRELKRESSKWIKTKDFRMNSFTWQGGYGAFSISPGHVKLLAKYIAQQEEHHRKEGFQDEFRRLLRKYDLEFDERYVWD